MKRWEWIAALVILTWMGAPARADECPPGADTRQRPGHDDVFVLLDSSLSMGPTSFGPWARGSMEPAREVLLHLADCYLRPGDFFLVGTFDSEARIEIAKEITDDDGRDLATLREQIGALGPSRPRYWDRLPGGGRGSERPGPAGRPIVGGSLRTDLGAALQFARRALEGYAAPDHRQLVLLFTDGEHDPPEFSPFPDREIDLASVLPRDARARHRLGVIALPGEDGEIASTIAELVDRWDPEEEARRNGEMAVIELDADASPSDRLARLIDAVERLLSVRIDLLAEPIDLGPSIRPEIDHVLPIANRSRTSRTIDIAEVLWRSDEGEVKVPLSVEPRRFDIPAGGETGIRVSGELGDLPAGAFHGAIRFRLTSAATFVPTEVEVRGTRLTWLEAYGHWLALGFLATATLAAAVFFYRRRSIWIAMTWSDGATTKRSVPTKLKTGGEIRFGGRGHGRLAVDGPGRRLGAVHRAAADRFLLLWEEGLPREEGSEAPAEALVPRRPERVPGHPDETVTFLLSFDRKRLERDLDALVPRRDDWHDDSASPLDATHF